MVDNNTTGDSGFRYINNIDQVTSSNNPTLTGILLSYTQFSNELPTSISSNGNYIIFATGNRLYAYTGGIGKSGTIASLVPAPTTSSGIGIRPSFNNLSGLVVDMANNNIWVSEAHSTGAIIKYTLR